MDKETNSNKSNSNLVFEKELDELGSSIINIKINKNRHHKKINNQENNNKKEKNDNMNLITEKKEKETINKLNLNTFDIQENKRYTINDKILDSHQETLKTKDNTISRYTKDSYTSKDNNAIQVNKIVNRFNNIHKYRDLYNKNNENKEIKNDINNNIKINENKYNTEIMPRYSIRKTRKEYFNERNKNNKENLK